VTSAGFVRLRCDTPALDVTVRLGAEPVTVTGGVGGWEVTPRPRQVSMTTWAGVEPVQVTLSLMFDGWAKRASQETDLRRLFAVARGDDESPPGIVTVDGVWLPADEWVIESIDYGDVIVDPSTMKRLRQSLTLTLREHVDPTFLQLRKTAHAASRGKTRVVTSRKGETVAKLARRVKCKWTDLRTLNANVVTKANQVLKPGTKLRVPVATPRPTRAKGSRKGTGKSSTRGK
jgi:hypothetical protein